MSIVIGPRAGKYEVLLWVAGQARGAEPAREREPVEPGKQVSGVTSEAVDEAVVHILRQHEAIVLVPSSGAGTGTPRHCLDEADAFHLEHRLDVEKRLLLKSLVCARLVARACLHQQEPVTLCHQPVLLKELPLVKLVLLQLVSLRIDQGKPEAALDGCLVLVTPERDDRVSVQGCPELLLALRLCGAGLGHARKLHDLHLAKLVRHLATAKVEAAARLAGAKDVAPGQRALSLRCVIVVAHAGAHVDLVRATRWLRLRDFSGGEQSRLVVAIEDVVCLPVAPAVYFRFGGRGLVLRQVESSRPRTWIDELAACASIHERPVWRVAGPVANTLAVHGASCSASITCGM